MSMIWAHYLCPYTHAYGNSILTHMLMGTASLHLCLWEQHHYTYAYGNSILTHMLMGTASLHLCLHEQHPYTYAYGNSILTPMLTRTASLHLCLWEQHPYTYAYGNSILTPMRTRTASLHLCLWEQHLKLPWCYFLHHSSDCIYELCPARSSRWNSVKTKDLGKLTYYSHKHWCSCRMAGVYKRKK